MNTTLRTDIIDEKHLLSDISSIIEKRKHSLVTTANSHLIFMFWEIGRYINQIVLEDDRANYGKKILSTVSTKLITSTLKEAKERIERKKYLTDDFNKKTLSNSCYAKECCFKLVSSLKAALIACI